MSKPCSAHHHTARIVTAYLTRHAVPAAEIPALIHSVHAALQTPTAPASVDSERTPAVPPGRSVFEDYLICLEDGRRLTFLKGYLKKHYNLSPAAYRERWKLPAHYPMVPPAYTRKRVAIAKANGLGTQRWPAKTTTPEAAPDIVEGVAVQYIPEHRRGRPHKLSR
ncbi:MucR family transcriptional regulator [Neokomagataea thailandica]|uniref:Ros/MucR family transcriptional regulator n=1 Tax=Neokomagataea tanensis NBRC 106556 TaxID=1223519 RepID=A0ABQ0QKW0_9PROT|nr:MULTISPECIES: MucR family transcriptional regulator [Neokomagataea]GBR48293.1 Ros/MucR family transcriptional regulator [Neokomagataea tanensis NBRC 106556]